MQQLTRQTPTGPARLADALAWIAAALAAVAALAGLLVPGLYRDGEAWIRQARAADFVTLLAVVPVLVVCLWRASSDRGRLVSVAALGYLVYTYAIFGFSVAINAMTPVHFAVLGLSTWALLLNVPALAGAGARHATGLQLPRRVTAFFLIAVALLFGALWLSQIAAAIATGRAPAELADLGLATNPVYTLDLAFALPLLLISGVMLLRRWSHAAEVGLIAVAWVALMGFGVLAIFGFDALAGAEVPVPVATFVGVITAIGTALTVVALLPARDATPQRGADSVSMGAAPVR